MELMQKYIIHKLYYVKIRLTENIRTEYRWMMGLPLLNVLVLKVICCLSLVKGGEAVIMCSHFYSRKSTRAISAFPNDSERFSRTWEV